MPPDSRAISGGGHAPQISMLCTMVSPPYETISHHLFLNPGLSSNTPIMNLIVNKPQL